MISVGQGERRLYWLTPEVLELRGAVVFPKTIKNTSEFMHVPFQSTLPGKIYCIFPERVIEKQKKTICSKKALTVFLRNI